MGALGQENLDGSIQTRVSVCIFCIPCCVSNPETSKLNYAVGVGGDVAIIFCMWCVLFCLVVLSQCCVRQCSAVSKCNKNFCHRVCVDETALLVVMSGIWESDGLIMLLLG